MPHAEKQAAPAVARTQARNAPFFGAQGQGLFAVQSKEQPAPQPFFAPLVQARCEACGPEDKLQRQEEAEVQAQAENSVGDVLQRQEEEEIQAQAENPSGEHLQRQEEEEIQAQAEEDIQQKTEDQVIEVQPKLSIGAPGDPYEREADAMAERVVNMPEAKAKDSLSDNSAQHTSIQRSITPLAAAITPLQRQESPEEEPEVQAQAETGALQLSGAAEPPDDEGEGGIQRQGEKLPSLSERFSQRLSARKGSGSPLPEETRSQMESGFGADFSGVRIHTDSEAVQMSQEAQAQAFTNGNDIYFNAGKFDPASSQGQRLLAHELTHTVQQGASVMRKEVVQREEAPDIQLLGIDTIISAASLAGLDLPAYARHVPGYTLFTVVVGSDPLTGQRVLPTAENLIGGLMGLLPFGTAIYDKLVELGVIQRALTWIRGELARCNLSLNRITQTFERAWADIRVSEGWDYNLAVLVRHFGALLRDVRTFAESLVRQLLDWVKEALVMPLHARVAQNAWYLVLTKILRQDPITGAAVSASTVEILEDVLRLAGKEAELEQMRARGTLQRSADWIDTQLGTFLSLLGELRGIFTAAWEAIQPANLPDIAQNFQNLAERFWGFLTRLTTFAVTVAAQVLQFIKDALLGLLREHASSIRGYRLFTVILGRDPVTQQPVERNARNIIAGFMELAAGREAYQQMEETGAIDRMAAWVDNLIQRYGISVDFIRNLFLGIWNSLTINDLIHPIDAFDRIVATFREPIARLLGFALEVIKKLIEVLLELMNFPTELILQIIQRATQAFEDIQRDPVGFLLNLLRAVKQGFIQFFGNIGSHLLSGLVGWLTSELRDAGVSPPRDFSLRGVITFVLDVLGITMERIWQKLAEHPQVGPQRVARVRQFLETAGQAAEGVWSFIQDVQREGIGAIWRHIQDQLSSLWDTVLDAVKSWIMERIITQMVTRLLSMLDPTGIMAVVNSFIAFYRAVQSFIEKLRQILEVINSFVGGIAEIARGTLTTAANFLENTLARSLPVIIGFLANQVGLRGLGARIGEMIGRVRALVDRALTWLVNRAVTMGGRLLNRLTGASGRDGSSDPRMAPMLQDLDQTQQQYLTNGKINQEEANQVANTVARRHSGLVRSVSAVNREGRWDYDYVQRATKQGAPDEGTPEPPALVKPNFANGAKASGFKVQYLKTGRLTGGTPANSNNGATLAGWASIHTSGLSIDSRWVKMHLLTEQLGGPALDSNLTPARGHDTNIPFNARVEAPAKSAVDAGKVIWYEVIIRYHSSPMQDYASSISMKWGPYVLENGVWVEKPVEFRVDGNPIGTQYSQNPLPPDFSGAPEIPSVITPESTIGQLERMGLSQGLSSKIVRHLRSNNFSRNITPNELAEIISGNDMLGRPLLTPSEWMEFQEALPHLTTLRLALAGRS